MKIGLIWKIIVCGLLCVFPVDIKGQTCQCSNWNGSNCKICTVGCYLMSEGWCDKCQTNCYSCSQALYCDECKTGYYNHTVDGDCRRCRYDCVICKSYYDCTSCIAGRTGSSCQHCNYGYYHNNGQCIKCNTNCLHGKCDVNGGQCNDGCQNGWSGMRCNDACAPTCASCQRYNTSTCNSCLFGYYGTSCEHECSSTCVAIIGARQCSETNGDCNSGCVDGWSGSKCTEKCDMNCISCDALDKAICHTCSPGYYGQTCSIECSSNCGEGSYASRQCQQDDGTCLDDCVMGYTGYQCDVFCDASCGSGCDRDTGICQQCKPGFFGPTCQHLCNATCYDPGNGSNLCHQLSGECLFDCSQLLCSPDEQTSGNQDNGVVIGGAVGSAVVIVLIIVAVLVFIFIKRRRKDQADPERSVTYENSPINNAYYTTLTPSLGAVPNRESIYEELDKNDEIDDGESKVYEVPDTSNYYNI